MSDDTQTFGESGVDSGFGEESARMSSQERIEQSFPGDDPEDEPSEEALEMEDMPFVFRRPNVHEPRTDGRRLDVLPETGEKLDELIEELNAAYPDVKIPNADIYEAAALVATKHPEAVKEQLNEWGWKMKQQLEE